MIFPARHISIGINASQDKVYGFVGNPENLPRWAAGLSQSKIKKSGDLWIADSPMGEVKVQFAAKNNFGVADHDVTLPNGQVVHNPLRVLKNGEGSEVVFTLYRLPDVKDPAYEEDAARVLADLKTLKKVMES